MSACAVLVGALLLAVVPAAAQTAPGSAAPVAESLQTISRLMARVPNASVSLNFAEFKVRMAAAKLQEAASAWTGEPPTEYRTNVAAQTAALEQALRAPDAEALTKILDALAEDLTAKWSHAEKGGATTVAVTVRTLRQGAAAEGWQVMYRPRVLDVARRAGTEATVPTAGGSARATLVPGRYVVWGRQGGADSAPIAVTIGEGLPDVHVDLDVAPSPRP